MYHFPGVATIRKVWLKHFPNDFGEKTIECIEDLANQSISNDDVDNVVCDIWDHYSSYTPRGQRLSLSAYFKLITTAIKEIAKN